MGVGFGFAIILVYLASSSPRGSFDKFGVKMIYPTASEGRQWYSSWDNGRPRVIETVDPFDREFDVDHGDATYTTEGDGILKITGKTPRMYVHDPENLDDWENAEITLYAMRVADNDTAWEGIQVYARTNHGTVGDENTNLCDDRGYGGHLTYHGNIRFEKETAHGKVNGYAQALERNYWPDGIPRNKWIGLKFVIRDVDEIGHVSLEMFVDQTDGDKGGNWSRILEFLDTGDNFGTAATPCTENVDPALALTASNNRLGSETGKPNLTVYFRGGDVGADGLLYKKASIREIEPISR